MPSSVMIVASKTGIFHSENVCQTKTKPSTAFHANICSRETSGSPASESRSRKKPCEGFGSTSTEAGRSADDDLLRLPNPALTKNVALEMPSRSGTVEERVPECSPVTAQM